MINITQGEIRKAFEISMQIPEFHPAYSWDKWESRLAGKHVIALVAESDGAPVGCKIGYYEEDWFYSWIGGVLPQWRGQGVATLLAERMELLVREGGVTRMRMKTHNKFKAMLQFAIGNGFDIVDVVPVEGPGRYADWRIVLEKKI